MNAKILLHVVRPINVVSTTLVVITARAIKDTDSIASLALV